MSHIPVKKHEGRHTTGEDKLVSGNVSSEPASEVMAAVARSLTRGLALYFSRPVRLFRPAKVTGWQFLKNIASQEGSSLTPSYVLKLCQTQGVWVVPKHFFPPILVNAALGTVLWTSYGVANDAITSNIGEHPIRAAALAGGFAGGCQALLAAPAENVRLLLEGGSGGHSWNSVWKEVFQSRIPSSSTTVQQEIHEIRELRTWMKEVGEMAGRGWDGWRWGCAKDVCAFSAFFTIFEITRRVSTSVTAQTQEWSGYPGVSWLNLNSKKAPKTVNACILVTGGVLAGLTYEVVSRPWDRIRRIVHVHQLDSPNAYKQSTLSILRQAVFNEGISTLYKDPLASQHYLPQSWLIRCGRTLARVGPWGVGFLAWEAFGSSLK
ncbi:hypothetical protein FA15DRAFT_663072 [Coprinopsis marcescibilis]|uniref:Mitochondrial carrier n=1 Tax=Coprinopsis marcescibilis TaxID=230819 RepID=A0A5C3L9U7_COPMA|nr:hypothetical protein FA15DRAFT_663072 [Coprinopsis marcescibilis]